MAKAGNKGYSSFFPDSWSKDKVKVEISNAFNNKAFVRGNEYKGYSVDGNIEIRMYLEPDGTLISSFVHLEL